LTRIAFGFRSVVCAALLSSAMAFAQQTATTTEGPVPPAIRAAKKIFISNTAAVDPFFSGGPDRPYNSLYATFKSDSQFELVADPSDADLVLELQIDYPGTGSDAFRLVIYDRKTHYVLWTLIEPMRLGGLQKTRDRQFDTALAALIQDFDTLVGKPPTPVH